jgi:hypothetical protein
VDKSAAITVAEQGRLPHGVPSHYAVTNAEERFIELSAAPDNAAGPVRDVRVWLVRFRAGIAWIELAVEQANGLIVRVQRSRA